MNTSIPVILAVAIVTAFMGASVPIEQAFASSAAISGSRWRVELPAAAAAGDSSAAVPAASDGYAAAAAGDSSSAAAAKRWIGISSV